RGGGGGWGGGGGAGLGAGGWGRGRGAGGGGLGAGGGGGGGGGGGPPGALGPGPGRGGGGGAGQHHLTCLYIRSINSSYIASASAGSSDRSAAVAQCFRWLRISSRPTLLSASCTDAICSMMSAQ